MRVAAAAFAAILYGLTAQSQSSNEPPRFASDLAFVRQHTSVLVLGDPRGAQIVVAPAYQGRVLTSTTGGEDAPSFGWIGGPRSRRASGSRT